MKLLCADIGGTNARVAIVEDLHVRQINVYPTRDIEGAVDLLKRFSEDTGTPLPEYAALAAAGVVEKNQVKGTNIPWDIDCDRLRAELAVRRCIILNDFEAAAWGLLAVDRDTLLKVGGSAADSSGTKAILGAGTGLGEAILVRCRNDWRVLRTEGGHASFSPRDKQGMALLSHLMAKRDHVSFERILSGSGLVEIYSFLVRDKTEKIDLLSSVSKQKRASHITGLADRGDDDALEAVDFFFKAYGEEASNLALKCLPAGGVYLTGGVTLHLLNFLLKGPFRGSFEDKGRMKPVLQKIPVFVVREPLLGILGAGYKLQQSLAG